MSYLIPRFTLTEVGEITRSAFENRHNLSPRRTPELNLFILISYHPLSDLHNHPSSENHRFRIPPPYLSSQPQRILRILLLPAKRVPRILRRVAQSFSRVLDRACQSRRGVTNGFA